MNEALKPVDFRGRLVIHIGPHKTGSSSIQSFLNDNYRTLRNQGVLYPRAGRRTSGRELSLHHPLMLSLIKQGEEGPVAHLDELRAEIASAAPEVVVLSSEVLAREYLSSEVFATLRQLFPVAEREWLIYLRRQDDLLLSRYAEKIKLGLIAWPDGIGSQNLPYYLDHRLRLEKLSYAVASDRVLPISFDATKHRLIQMFFEECRIQVPESDVRDYHINQAHPWGALHLARIANALPRGPGGFLRRSALFLGRRLNGTRVRFLVTWGVPLSRSQRAAVLAQYEASNRWVEKEFFADVPVLTCQYEDIATDSLPP